MIRVYHLDFLGQGALLYPKDEELHDKAIEFCSKELTREVNLTHFNHVWLSGLCDSRGNMRKVTGVTGYGLKADIALFRSIEPESTQVLGQRLNSHFNDLGMRGNEVFLHLASQETPEQRCSQFEQTLKAFEAKPADRWAIEVK